ncbi:DUF6266 family protein [Desertivirga xinjiangensis]|uniref:DUF6266 family protein n=1 Tax=Desertivirga xinjiangensis TaxID=539206 RepID=UPI00210C2AAD|nr:DUF6266 family protein [Pedobacter xinjiangensis]
MSNLNGANLFPFSGALGDKVFCNGKIKRPYVRKRPTGVKSASAAQLQVRAKLKKANLFVNTFRQIICICWTEKYKKMYPFDAAMSHVLTQAIKMEDDEPRILFDQVWLSRGKLIKPLSTSFQFDKGEAIVQWTSSPKLSVDDEAIAVFYNETAEAGLVLREKAIRKDGFMRVVLPKGFVKGKIHGYLLFLKRNGKDASPTTYLGFISNT